VNGSCVARWWWRAGGSVGIIKVRRPGTVFILAPIRSAADERISGFVLYIFFLSQRRRRRRVLYNIIIIIRCTMSVCSAVQNKKKANFSVAHAPGRRRAVAWDTAAAVVDEERSRHDPSRTRFCH